MTDIDELRSELKAPRAAAVAGILFSVLLLAYLVLIRLTVPANPQDAGAWLADGADRTARGLHIVPFAGIAFLWFMGVLRDRLGQREDRLFATVFLGSGLLFLALLFASAAVAGSVLRLYAADPARLVDSGLYAFGRTTSYEMINVYTLKMAGVFMMTTSSLSLRTGIIPRWMARLGFALALFLLLSLGTLFWAPLVFPLWVLLISVYILVANLRQSNSPEPSRV